MCDCSSNSATTIWRFWWTWSGSNRRPLPCHGSALPAAPQAHFGNTKLQRQSYSRLPYPDSQTASESLGFLLAMPSIPKLGRDSGDGDQVSTTGIVCGFLIAFGAAFCPYHALSVVLVAGAQASPGSYAQSTIERIMGATGERKSSRDSRFCSHSCIMFSAVSALLEHCE